MCAKSRTDKTAPPPAPPTCRGRWCDVQFLSTGQGNQGEAWEDRRHSTGGGGGGGGGEVEDLGESGESVREAVSS